MKKCIIGISYRAFCLIAFTIVAAAVAAAESVKSQTRGRARAWRVRTQLIAYVDLTSDTDAALVAAGSSLAARVELHSMTMDGGVMRMRPLERVELPGGQDRAPLAGRYAPHADRSEATAEGGGQAAAHSERAIVGHIPHDAQHRGRSARREAGTQPPGKERYGGNRPLFVGGEARVEGERRP